MFCCRAPRIPVLLVKVFLKTCRFCICGGKLPTVEMAISGRTIRALLWLQYCECKPHSASNDIAGIFQNKNLMYGALTTSSRTISILMLTALCACSAGQSDRKSEKKLAKQEKKLEKAAKREEQNANSGSDQAATNGAARFGTTGCDESLWSRVYNPARLQKLSPCIAVSGTVTQSSADDDGDQHFLLKLDAGEEALVNETNARKKNGDLVVEIVCANPVLLAKVKSVCEGFRNAIAIPRLGEHVRATGSYVIDSHNGWAEVHPVSKLQRI